MVYQMPCPNARLLFVASTLTDEGQAQLEIQQWALSNGYRPPQEDKTFVFYQAGVGAREWRLVERPLPA